MTEATTILYKRATFVTQLPVGHLFTRSHCWLAPAAPSPDPTAAAAPQVWRVGYTKFALRMLGELVDVQFEKPVDAAVAPGDVIGSIEGFKALSDIYCVAGGAFRGGNPALREGLDRITRAPYSDGWLYEIFGHPEAALNVSEYQELLDATIDRILAKQQMDEAAG